jgi:hypothetical protein
MQPTSRSPWKLSRQKGPDFCSRTGFCLGSTHQVHTAISVQESLASKGIETIPHPPYLLDITPVDFFLFPRVKSELAGLSTVPGQLQDELGRGYADHCQRWVCHTFWRGMSAAISAFGSEWLPWETLQNKHLSNSNCCLFIKIFKFGFDST